MNERNEFDELLTNAIFALNSLMQCDTVCENDTVVVKINRFKKYLNKVGKELVNNSTNI